MHKECDTDRMVNREARRWSNKVTMYINYN